MEPKLVRAKAFDLDKVKIEDFELEHSDAKRPVEQTTVERTLNEPLVDTESPPNGSAHLDLQFVRSLYESRQNGESLVDSPEASIEFLTVKVEPLDCGDDFDLDSRPPPPAVLPPGIPEPGFSMTVPLKVLKEKKKSRKGRGAYQCELCSKTYEIKSRLERHIKGHLSVKPKKRIDCNFCTKTFQFRHQLIKHSVRHSHERPFSCYQCGKTFRYQGNLLLHIKGHADIHEVCDQCGKVFTSHGGVSRHKQRMHDALTGADYRPYSCDQCGGKFRSNRNLMVHQRSHLGLRPHACEYCEKTFIDRSTLNRHNRIHTGVKPYQCETCAKSFTDHGSLKFHVSKYHTGERPHRCTHCGTAYHHRSNLKRHLLTHLPREAKVKKEKVKREGGEKKVKPKQKRGRKVKVKIEPSD